MFFKKRMERHIKEDHRKLTSCEVCGVVIFKTGDNNYPRMHSNYKTNYMGMGIEKYWYLENHYYCTKHNPENKDAKKK